MESLTRTINPDVIRWLKILQWCIVSIQRYYSKNKGVILTEGDLECLLYSCLVCQTEFHQPLETKTEGWATGFIHSQTTWFKKEKESGFEVDLCISDPKNFMIYDLLVLDEYPNKGYFHDGMSVAIELKFIRNSNAIKKESTEDYIHIVNELRPAKNERIESEYYSNITMDDIAFVSIVGCK